MDHNLPVGFIENLRQVLDENEIKELITTIKESKQPTSIRINPDKYSNHLESSHDVPWCPYGKYLDLRPSFILDPMWHAGAYYVQEASSMLIYQVLTQYAADNQDATILDLCAAPGGKSTLIATWLKNRGCLVSNEVIKSRAYTLKQNVAKEGYSNVIVTNNDPQDFGKLDATFDAIFIDAPCSGEGMFRKDSAAIGEWSQHNVQLCSARQRRIVGDVLPSLRKNGIIIYSTCTYNKAENIENVKWMCQTFELESVPLSIQESWGVVSYEEDSVYGYQCFPHKVEGEGFFISVMRKTADDKVMKIQKDVTYLYPEKKQKEEINKWVNINDTSFTLLIDKADNVHALNINCESVARKISKELKIIATGVTVGTLTKGILIPDHSLAQSNIVNTQIPHAELNLEEALAYLRKELNTIQSDKTSWHIASFEGLGIGWLKNLGTRINNYLPNELRVLKRS